MSRYLWHFEVHYVEVWDNVYLDILDEEEKKILEYLWECEKFWDYFSDYEFDSPPRKLYFSEISEEEAKTISKYVTCCKSYWSFIYDWLDDLYWDKHDDYLEGRYTLEQVKEIINDTDS